MASQEVFTVLPTTEQKIEAIKLAGDKALESLTTLTEKDLEEKLPEKASDLPSGNGTSYTCVTQRTPPPSSPDRISPAAIMVGLGQEIPRWKYGSVIKYAAYARGYPGAGDAVYAFDCLRKAANEWNDANVGVTFKWVPKLEDASFVLAYGGNLGGVLASAFFPGKKELETLFVYQYAFDKTQQDSPKRGKFTNYGIMKNVFLHELGHVLGLRHEFAMDPKTPEGDEVIEGGAIVIGKPNKESVMSYEFPPEIQDSDKEDTRYFYKHPLIVDYEPN